MKASKLAKELEKLVYSEGDFDVFVKQDTEDEPLGVCFHIATLENDEGPVGYVLLSQDDTEEFGGVPDEGRIYDQ